MKKIFAFQSLLLKLFQFIANNHATLLKISASIYRIYQIIYSLYINIQVTSYIWISLAWFWKYFLAPWLWYVYVFFSLDCPDEGSIFHWSLIVTDGDEMVQEEDSAPSQRSNLLKMLCEMVLFGALSGLPSMFRSVAYIQVFLTGAILDFR